MAVEAATVPSELNPALPLSSDGLHQADDHLRLLKTVLKTTFPNLEAPVTETAAVLNAVDGRVDTLDGEAIKNNENGSITGDLAISGTLTVAGDDFADKASTAYVDAAVASGVGGIPSPTDIADAWPIGSIYMNSAVATNPGSLLGFGTWTALAPGKVLIGVGGGHTLGETGGAETHQLTPTEMPAHVHSAKAGQFHLSSNAGDGSRIFDGTGGTSVYYGDDTASAGGDGAHNNMQPYLTVHMWVRTA